MVQIVGYKKIEKEGERTFFLLEVQGGLESVKSKTTGKLYLTARKASVFCSFDEITCQGLIGTKLEGGITKVEVEPYEFVIKETGEMISRNHRYEFVTEEDLILNENLAQTEDLIPLA
jgi:hypothetical protein